MNRTGKKLLAFLLAILMISTNAMGVLAETAPVIREEGNDTGTMELETRELDPATLHVPKLGEIPEEEEEETPELAFGPNDLVRVSIVLEEPSTLDMGYDTASVGKNSSADAYRQGLLRKQQSVTAAINAAVSTPIEVKWNLTLTVNIISANVRYRDIPIIGNTAGVRRVVLENRYEPQVDTVSDPNTANTSSGMVGATGAWADGYTGAGSRIAIIDTGLDTTHQSFAEDAFNYSISRLTDTPDLMERGDIPSTGLNGRGTYLSAKIPYAYNYVDNNTTVNHLSDREGEHGSHVAGIAAANRYIKSGSNYVDAATAVHAVGMAPDAQLLIMKVFGAGGGAYDSDYMAAIEDALVLQCDSVNLSLGSSSQGWTYADEYQEVMNKLTNSQFNTKTVVTISAGNSYGLTEFLQTDLYSGDVSMHTGGSPGTFINSLGTAAAQNIGVTGSPLVFNGNQTVYYTETELSGSRKAMTSVAGSYSYVYIDCLGNAQDYRTVNSTISLTDKVVIVNRGDLSFYEKANNVKSYNPKAVIIANNQPGTIRMDLDDYTGSFPVVSITLPDAQQIMADGTAHTTGSYTYYTGTVQVESATSTVLTVSRENAEMTEFSSWGVPGSLLMKPEITAPGGDIYSVYGTNLNQNGVKNGGPDMYEFMSGTSMAAPHMAGLAAVAAQYLRDNAPENSALTSAYSLRAINQSLLMSTATPMINNGNYVSILQQGAGLADVQRAVESRSVVMVGGDTLTTATGAAADGKVKVEFGDKPERAGTYSYSFMVYNITDKDIEYSLSTDLFTQALYEDQGSTFMSPTTEPLGWQVTYDYDSATVTGHDVNRDGVTSDADAQAVLDYLTGILDGSTLDLAAGEMDGDNVLTTYDAYLLLQWEGASADGFVVPAHGSKTAVVTISIPADTSEMDAAYPGGAYVEGFTYLRSSYTTTEGESVNEEHSIPLLGFYGSWTDASMFDNTSYVDTLYGTEKIPYTGRTNTNYMTVSVNGISAKYAGNPYMVEEEFPAERLAMNSRSVIGSIYYNLYRAAGTTGFAVSKIDGIGGNVTSVQDSLAIANGVEGIYYVESTDTWYNLGTKSYNVNKTLSSYGLAQGDLVRVGFYAIPEYNAMKLNEDMTDAEAGMLGTTGFRSLLLGNVLGKGAFVGYDFAIDDEAPEIETATLSGSQLTVSASDNLNLAYVAVLSLDGDVVYAQAAPGQETYSVTFDAADAIANAQGYVAVFAGDYAGNETARAIKVNDNIQAEKTIYVLTNELVAGQKYLIVNRNSTGNGAALGRGGSQGTTVTAYSVTVKPSDSTVEAPYIDGKEVADTSVWTVSDGFKFQNGSYYLGRNNASLQISQTNPNNSWNWDGTNNRLSIVNNTRTYYLRYNNNTFSLNTATNSVYLYKEVKISYEVDPYGVTSIQVIPDSMELYKGNEADAVATVSPLTAEDRTVTWSSGNEAVATVDSYGHIVAVGAGTTEITATSNSNPAVKASCTVNVVSVNKQLNGIIWDEEGGVYFSNFNVSSLPTWNKLHDDNKNLPLQSAFMQSATQLYAATMDVDAMTTMLYSVNRNTYALTEYGENFVLAMDTARASTQYTGYYVYAFGSFLIFGNIAPEDDGEGGYYSGLPYGVLDLGETTGDDTYIAGVAARSIGTTSSSFYFLDENGTIWQTTFRIGSSVTFGNPTKVVDTGISTNFLYQTLYYDGTYLYWGHTDDNSAELIIINPNTKAVYHAGDFGEGVWPVTGFYVNGSVAPSSVEDGTVEAQDLSGLKPVATRAELMTEAVMNRFAAEVAKKSAKSIPAGKLPEVPAEEPVAEGSAETVIPDDEPAEPAQQTEETVAETAEESVEVQEPEETAVPEDPAADPEEEVEQILEEESSEDGENAEADEVQNPVTGGTNAFAKGRRTPAKNFIRDSVTVMPSSVIPGGEETDSSRTASITEATSVTNGLYEITYDPDSVTVSAGDSALTYTSFNDDGEGKILFAFARDPHTAEGEAILNITFAAVDCEGQSEITAKTTEAGTRFDHENGVETETFHVAPINHDFGTPEYSWTDDYLNCTATAVCSRNSAHVLTETVSATFEVTKPATCESAGETTYTATFTNSAFETQTRTIANIDAIGHDYTLTKWTWSADGTSATATFTCSRDSGHQQVIPATMTVEQTDATCTEPGYVTYTATVEFEGKTYTDDASDLIPALGHDWNAPSFTWADDHSSATATFTCSRDAEHVQAVPAEVTSAVDPETGAMTFTATVVFEGTTYTESKTLEAYLTLEESFVETVIKATEQLHAASNMPITWTVEAGGEKILSVDENGLVTAKYPGTAKVTASILDGSISVSCDFKVEFIDVTKEADYFYTPVYWAVENGITTGFTDSNGDLTGYFKPGDTCTRGQIVTFLWRSKGSPKVTATASTTFKDVKKNTYYYDAVVWAASEGITTGYMNSKGKPSGNFGPEDPCTRAQIVTFLWRANGKPVVAVTESSTFKDVKKGAYYYDAVVWAAENGITTGYTNSSGQPTGKFGSDDPCTRGQVVTFLYRAEQ